MIKLNEEFEIKYGKFNQRSGRPVQLIYIDPKDSEKLYPYNDDVKKYGAKWFGALKTFGWEVTGDTESLIKNKVEPCLRFLKSVSGTGENEMESVVIGIIDGIKSALKANADAEPDDDTAKYATSKELTSKLDEFKMELIRCVSDEEFKKKIDPIIKFKRAMGHAYSLTNSFLIYIQDPTASMVKSRKNWLRANRKVKVGAHAIWMWIPVGDPKYTKDDIAKAEQEYVNRLGVKNKNELTVGQQEEMNLWLRQVGLIRGFKLAPNFYDYKETEQIEGKEDLVGSPDADIEWHAPNDEETEDTLKYIELVLNIIKANGITVDYKNNLGGALGVSKGGHIDMLEGIKKNTLYLQTLIHEFAHEILHQEYARDRDSELSAYFLGKDDGKGPIEQQAELTSWIVMRYIGYDMPSSVNYAACWGMDEKNAVIVFNKVAKLSEKLYKLIMKEADSVNKNTDIGNAINEALNESGANFLTGREIAELVGFGDVYDKGYQEEIDEINENFMNILNKIKL